MSDLLGIGASAVATYRSALAVVGDNVANAETEGYARRNVSIRPSAAAGAINPLYTGTNVLGGSEAAGVTRAWDAFKATDARSAIADDARASAATTWLDAAEGAVDDGDTGVGAKVTAVFTAGSTLAADPASGTARAAMLGAIGDAAGAIRGSATGLARVSAGVSDAAAMAARRANDGLGALAQVNVRIARAADGSEAKATLADQRDALLADISAQVGIDAKIANDGTATVTLAGGSATLLAGNAAAQLSVAVGADGRLAIGLDVGGTTTAVSPTGGALAGLVDAASGIAGRRAGLDAVATTFAGQLNGWNTAGRTAAGAPGAALLAVTGGAAGLTLVATSGDAIAAAGADGTANGNLLSLGDLRGADGAEQKLATLVGTHAQALASAKAQASAAATRKSAALVAQGDASGVSLDQEAADLVRYQQAYAGAAKVIQAAQTTLQAILALF